MRTTGITSYTIHPSTHYLASPAAQANIPSTSAKSSLWTTSSSSSKLHPPSPSQSYQRPYLDHKAKPIDRPRGLHARFSRSPRSTPRLAGDSASLLERFSRAHVSVERRDRAAAAAREFVAALLVASALPHSASVCDGYKVVSTSPGGQPLLRRRSEESSLVFRML
ncbi:hypothetical protein M440DRAFT_337676 [Trichoderma longibrachiatum ATCC 18648]|uniref:Uncharacterized protein n=1 Tax=Trichoderma longibrachiatum ATCC 18648 TaxID=983965 RepID=A0A2T4C0N7_TRILO|nr:hypothetical protein M440DRAFT_337676 [Trichoderma longibrachiatum ATCC 18648]